MTARPGSELVCDPELENVLHHRQLIRDGQRATRGGRTPRTSSYVRNVERTESVRGIPEIGEAILGTSDPMARKQRFSAESSGPPDLSTRVCDYIGPQRSGEVVAEGAV